MDLVLQHWSQVAAAYTIYLVAVISPGPAVMAIIAASISGGRKTGLTLAAGVFAGSFTWAVAAALGLAAVLQTYAELLYALKIAGGFYLLYLGYKALRSALRKEETRSTRAMNTQQNSRQVFLRGYAIHLTNPKAIFAWVAIISLGLPANAPASAVAIIVGGCLLTGLTVFTTYALLFSTEGALNAYRAARRWIDGAMAALFCAAGVKLLTARL